MYAKTCLTKGCFSLQVIGRITRSIVKKKYETKLQALTAEERTAALKATKVY
jgi:hypothetical protein